MICTAKLFLITPQRLFDRLIHRSLIIIPRLSVERKSSVKHSIDLTFTAADKCANNTVDFCRINLAFDIRILLNKVFYESTTKSNARYLLVETADICILYKT